MTDSFPAPHTVSLPSLFSLSPHSWTQRPRVMDQTNILDDKQGKKSICDAVTVTWWVASQVTVCSHCSHWGGRKNPWVRRLCCSWLSHSWRGKKGPAWASNRLGKQSWVPCQVTCACRTQVHSAKASDPMCMRMGGGRPSTTVTARFQGFSWTSQRCHFTCLRINLV